MVWCSQRGGGGAAGGGEGGIREIATGGWLENPRLGCKKQKARGGGQGKEWATREPPGDETRQQNWQQLAAVPTCHTAPKKEDTCSEGGRKFAPWLARLFALVSRLLCSEPPPPRLAWDGTAGSVHLILLCNVWQRSYGAGQGYASTYAYIYGDSAKRHRHPSDSPVCQSSSPVYASAGSIATLSTEGQKVLNVDVSRARHVAMLLRMQLCLIWATQYFRPWSFWHWTGPELETIEYQSLRSAV